MTDSLRLRWVPRPRCPHTVNLKGGALRAQADPWIRQTRIPQGSAIWMPQHPAPSYCKYKGGPGRAPSGIVHTLAGTARGFGGGPINGSPFILYMGGRICDPPYGSIRMPNGHPDEDPDTRVPQGPAFTLLE